MPERPRCRKVKAQSRAFAASSPSVSYAILIAAWVEIIAVDYVERVNVARYIGVLTDCL